MEASRPLKNPRRELFTRFYVETGNGAESYRQAGFSPNSAKVAAVKAAELLARPEVRARVDYLLEQAGKKHEITAERILGQLAEFAFESAGDDKVKTSDRVRSLELLGKRFGLWIERVAHEGPAWREIFEKLPPQVRRQVLDALRAAGEGNGGS